MSAGNFQSCLKEVLKHEGGFVNHPKDPGGMTNLGVTKATYESYVGHVVTEQTMRSLTQTTVSQLYLERIHLHHHLLHRDYIHQQSFLLMLVP